MIQLTIIRIEGYGPWTLTLGFDREAELQMLQAKIYYDVQRLFHEKDCIVYFNRFDEYFAITNGLSVEEHTKIQHLLAGLYKDLKMSMAIGVGRTAFEASMNAYRARSEKKTGSLEEDKNNINNSKNEQIFFYSAVAGVVTQRDKEKETGADVDGEDKMFAQIMHIDVDSSTKLAGRLSPYEVTALVAKLYGLLAEEFLKLDALTFFLGGDNFMIISNGVPKNLVDGVIKKVTSSLDDIVKFNCGIGIGKNGRLAAKAATQALDTIRSMRDQGKIQTIYEIQC
jgi:GTP cyclohydrolase IIa